MLAAGDLVTMPVLQWLLSYCWYRLTSIAAGRRLKADVREITCFSGFVFQTTEQISLVFVMLFCGVTPMGESLMAAF